MVRQFLDFLRFLWNLLLGLSLKGAKFEIEVLVKSFAIYFLETRAPGFFNLLEKLNIDLLKLAIIRI